MSSAKTRSMRMVVGAVLVSVGVLAAACSSSFAIGPGAATNATATAAAVASSEGPPRLTASSEDRSGPLGLGAYCWLFEAGAAPRCADDGIVTTAQVLTAAPGGAVTIEGLPAGARAVTTVTPRAGVPVQEGANRLSWVAGVATPLAAQADGARLRVTAPLPSGQYLLALQVQLDSGDATYGLQLDVR